MATYPDHDPILQSLRVDLRARLAQLNELHHPVYPSAPARIAEMEAMVAELRGAITTRRALLSEALSEESAAATAAKNPGTSPAA